MHVTIYSTDLIAPETRDLEGYGSVLHYTDSSGKLHVKELSQGFKNTQPTIEWSFWALSPLLKCLNALARLTSSDPNTW